VKWAEQTGQTASDPESKTKVLTVGKVTNMSHDEGNKGDQYKSYYKEVTKESWRQS
jgi:hypothetical protein